MFESVKNLFALPDLRMRIGITVGALLVYRIGCHVPAPGVNPAALEELLPKGGGGVLGLMDLFSGGALTRGSVFALGIMPYITMSIIMQLMTTAIPTLEKLSKEPGEEGRRKINQWTRIGTVGLCLFQSFGAVQFLRNISPSTPILTSDGLGTMLLLMMTLTTGTICLMWIGEQVTEHGVGNGISLLIFAGIVARVPYDLSVTLTMVRVGDLGLLPVLLFFVLLLAMVGLTVVTQQAHRKVPIQYPQRTRAGFPAAGGVNTSLPLKIDYSGVIAVIFASALLTVPSMGARMLYQEGAVTPWQRAAETFTDYFAPGTILYSLVFGVLILFFIYFATAIYFKPDDVADNLKRWGGFVPGIRPGPATAEYLDRIVARIILVGAVGIVVICLVPDGIAQAMRIPFYFGGTTMLITVGVALDTLKQLESHLLMHHYGGFLKKAKLQGRSLPFA